MSASAIESGAALDLTELGRRLTQAREALPLTLDEVAQRLHLPSATVADLEAGRSERIGTAVYMKGFLRSYLKLLNLPEAWADTALGVGAATGVPPILPAAGAVARRVSWLERYKWAASYVVGTALALTAVHWLVSNTPQLGFPDAPRPGAVALDAPPLPPATVASSVTEPQPSVAVLGPVPSAPPANDQTDLPVMASLNPFRVPGDEPASDGASSVLTLRFDQASWVDVRDARGAKLAFQTVAAGEQRIFSAGAPFSVLIGNARGVRAEVAGAQVDLTTFVRGNIARFGVAEGAQGWAPVASDKDTSSRDDG